MVKDKNVSEAISQQTSEAARLWSSHGGSILIPCGPNGSGGLAPPPQCITLTGFGAGCPADAPFAAIGRKHLYAKPASADLPHHGIVAAPAPYLWKAQSHNAVHA